MLKDGKPYYLTFDEAVSLHRQMWNDMLTTYGDTPHLYTRMDFKEEWLDKHGYSDVRQNCFLCEYVTQMQPRYRKHRCFIDDCPIKWDSLCRDYLCRDDYQGCVSTIVAIRKGHEFEPIIGPAYGVANISDILALPVREKMDWEKEEDLSIKQERGE